MQVRSYPGGGGGGGGVAGEASPQTDVLPPTPFPIIVQLLPQGIKNHPTSPPQEIKNRPLPPSPLPKIKIYPWLSWISCPLNLLFPLDPTVLVPCGDVEGCIECSSDGLTCSACDEGFVLDSAQTSCIPIERNRLSDATIIGKSCTITHLVHSLP